MTRLADQRGMTLVELLLAATLMLVITGATLSLLAATSRQHRIVEQHNESQQHVRAALDQLARDLRNLAAPADLTTSSGIGCHGARATSIGRNGPYDLVYCAIHDVKPVGSLNAANVKRVRYCLQTTNPERAVLWQQTQLWTTGVAPAMPADTACPGSGWDAGQNRIVADSVVNVAGGAQRPVFRYAGDLGAITATDDDARGRIARVRADLYVDHDTARDPRAAHLATAAFLRNQNREPTASFTIDVLNPTTPLIELNGTASQDPESRRLTYQFYRNPPNPLPDCGASVPHSSCILPASARVQLVPPAGSQTFVLEVRDPGGLRATATRIWP